ncbi:MAG: threonine ammonia-lyase [Methanomicrobiales archaeon]
MVTGRDVRDAAARISGRVIRTPLVYSPTFSEMTGAEVYLKLETLQRGGSFKVRGAMNFVLARRMQIGPEGVVAASAGNHAQGVAIAARAAGVPATVVMPMWASPGKQQATAGYGARVRLTGSSLEEAVEKAKTLEKEGMLLVHPYDHPEIIAGQGTVGLEIVEDLPDPDLVVVPVGGGGLIAGIAAALSGEGTRIVGVQAAACPSAVEALAAGHPVSIPAHRTLADGIRVRRVGDHPFRIIRDHVDGVALVGEDAITDAVLHLLERKKVLAEGAGAVGLAALLSGVIEVPPGSRVAVVISGGNIDATLLYRVIRKALFRRGRLIRFQVWLDDRPGALTGLMHDVESAGGTILRLDQSRSDPDLPTRAVRIHMEVESRCREESDRLLGDLRNAGYQITIPH